MIADILWKQDIETLDHYVSGIGPRTWRHEMHTVYTSEIEATADADVRLAAVAAATFGKAEGRSGRRGVGAGAVRKPRGASGITDPLDGEAINAIKDATIADGPTRL